MSELRYHPFLDQWVITATHRQDRTFLPPADYNPLAPTKPGGFPTEIPFESYDIVVFENKFPSLSPNPPEPAVHGTALLPVRKSAGVCEVICYTQDPDATFAQLSLHQARKLTRVWRDRYVELGSRTEVEYVFIFENKGKEIGVTLSHPHGQIYAYPFVPPIPKQELEMEAQHYEANGRPLMQDVIRHACGDCHPDSVTAMMAMAPASGMTGDLTVDLPAQPQAEGASTLVWQNEAFVAFVPFFARYPYEVYIAPREHRTSLAAMTDQELDQLAEAMLVVTRKYDRLFGFSLPYIMAMHQAPTMPGYDFAWFHVEFYPPYRTANKLKYLAGSEAGAGAFINDTLPEETSKTLRDLDVTL